MPDIKSAKQVLAVNVIIERTVKVLKQIGEFTFRKT